MTKAPITTHILDLHTGKPASGINVKLFSPNSQNFLTQAVSDKEGRIDVWTNGIVLSHGIWKLEFETKIWFYNQERDSFFSDIHLRFNIVKIDQHYHVPLLLNEFGYSSYRGS